MGWLQWGGGFLFCFVLFPPPLCRLCSKPHLARGFPRVSCRGLGTGAQHWGSGPPAGLLGWKEGRQGPSVTGWGVSRSPGRLRMGRCAHACTRTHTLEKATPSHLQGDTCHELGCD